MCSRAWCAQWPGFDSARAHPPTKELFLIIPTHMMNREIIPGRKKEGSTVSSINCDRCRQLDLAVSCLPAAPAWVKANRLGWPLVGIIHRAKPDSRPRLEGARYRKLLTPTQSLLHPTLANIHRTHLPIPFLSLGKRTGPLYGLSMGSRVGWTPARKERTNRLSKSL